jgi:pimeloyl-ACP methyl ester carboxylesterase
MWYRTLLILTVILLPGCQTVSPVQRGPTSTPFPDPFNGSVKVGDYSLSIACAGSGEPTIIILMGGYYDWNWSFKELTKFKEISRTCLYYRADQSGIHIPEPTTAQRKAKELHILLKNAGLPKPVILVGFTYSRSTMRMYAQQYPDEVKGLVFVSCLPPAFEANLLEKLNAAAATMPELVNPILVNDHWAGDYAEMFVESWPVDLKESNRQVLQVTSLGSLLLVILHLEGPVVTVLNKIFDEATWAGNQHPSTLSTHSRLECVPGSTYDTLLIGDATKKAVQEVYEAVKKP